MLSVDDLKAALPRSLQSNATQEFADKLNSIASDPEEARAMRESFLTYSKVLVEGNYRTEDYLNAVAYATFKLMGHTNKDAYMKAFPDRYQVLIARGANDKQISAYVAMYHKNKIVNQILEQAVIPMWLLNQDVYQKAINKQLSLMMDDEVSPMVQQLAANSILLHLKQPETKKVELDVNLRNGGGLAELRETMAVLAEQQARLIADGAGAKTVSRVPLRIGAGEDVVDVPMVATPTPVQQPQRAPVLARAPQQPQPQPIVQPEPVKTTKPSLFEVVDAGVKLNGEPLLASVPTPQGEVKTVNFEFKSQAFNYARCCDSVIEDCVCIETDHIYLPTSDDVPIKKRVSLFDDPAGMP